MVDYILREAPPGVLVECGCYQGGSSAKLCLVAAMTARKLYVCDSFQGLPEVTALEGGWRTIAGQQNGFSRGSMGFRWNKLVRLSRGTEILKCATC